MKGQLVRFLETTNINLPAQKETFSTVTAVLSLEKKMLGSFEDEMVALMMWDLTKAFDIISHNILLGKLKHYMASTELL